MTVRRLAELQPDSFVFTPENEAWAKSQIAKYPPGRQASAVIALLWRAQAQHDYWLPKVAIEKVADMLGMPYIRVLEIATFYSMYNLQPVGKYFVQVCGTTPCMLRGSDDIRAVCEKRIGPSGHVSSDGFFAWAEVECLGACCNAPMVQINDDYYEDLTKESFAGLLEDLAAGRPVKKGSLTGRVASEPEPNQGTTLSDPSLFDGSTIGAWRQRFEEEAAKAAEAPKAEAVPPPPVAAAAPPVPPPTLPAAGSIAPEPVAEAVLSDAKVVEEEKAIADKLATLPANASAEDKANAVGTKPKGLTSPRGDKADDLQKIRGIGKVNEAKLNALGVFHYDQIGNWEHKEIIWVGTYLAFPGRIDRENWVGQAKALAAASEKN